MSKPKDTILYEKAKSIIYKQYITPSAYRSGALVKLYKQLYKDKYKDSKAYEGTKPTKGLTQWFKEEWQDINPNKTKDSYPVYRPTQRVNKDTPKTKTELSKERIKEQSQLKQKIKNKKLPKF